MDFRKAASQNATAELPPAWRSGKSAMKSIRTYSMQFEADLARIALEGVGIPAVVVGVSMGMQGGMEGVQLLVPDDRMEAALKVLEDLETQTRD